ncbi:hypothetical protein [Silvanigrella aquatica]|uniref:Uncharacterized protein n=1 Tax=Silvanigrella aquatica TaxID=1915309 RepID=A0A1L4CZP5_9BACT|nr:hypothetical protein [Silvanigrella aquatica]APJ03421.1 hypothetical protein AXG55_05680 [Silvanigrella aquatica]
MAVTIYAWTHNQKSTKDTLLKKSNCGHCSLEITGTKESIDKINEKLKLTVPGYQNAEEIIENFKHSPQQVDLFIPNKSEEEKIIARENDLNECLSIYEKNKTNGQYDAMAKGINQKVLEAAQTLKKGKIPEYLLNSYIIKNKSKIMSTIYFSFFPGSKYDEKPNNENNKKNISNNFYNIINNRIQRDQEYIYKPEFKSYAQDCSIETMGVDISKIFADLKPENLEEDFLNYKMRSSCSEDDWLKKERKFYKVKSGILKGITITAATYTEYVNFLNLIIKNRKIKFRHIMLDEDANINENILNKFLKNEYNYFNILLEDLSFNIKTFNKKINQSKNIEEINSLKNKINKLELMISQIQSTYSNVKNYLHVSGLPPSDIITFPSLHCDGYGLDEVKIIQNWVNIIENSDYHFDTTNCSWAIKTVFLPVIEPYFKIQNHMRIMPWSPLEVASIAKQAQKEFLKKHNGIIFNSQLSAPKKNLYTKKEFLKIISEKNKNIQIQSFFHLRKIELEDILILLDRYHRIGDFQINHRVIFIEHLKEKIANYMHKISENTKQNKESRKLNSINLLYQLLILEEDSLMSFLLGVKGKLMPTHSDELLQKYKYLV